MKFWKIGTVGLVLVLLIVNIFLFSSTIAIGDNIAKLERDTHSLQIVNMDLQQKLFTVNSLDHLNKVAESLGFTKEAQPITINNLTYALAQ